MIRDDVLHTLIERQLIIGQLQADKIDITDAEVEARFLEKARGRGQTREQAEEEIRAQQKTLQDVKEKLRWHTLGVEKLYEAHARDKKVLTDIEARQVYLANPAEFAQEHERRVSRILINASPDASPAAKTAARTRAEDVLNRLKAGEDFAGLARIYSEDPTTRMKGGDRGWSPRGFVTAPGNDPFGDVAFAMKEVGEVSGIVETLDGYEIIQLTGVKEARQKSFDEVKSFIIERERYWEIGNFWEQFAVEMRNKASIQWDPGEALRRAKKEKREREYNVKIEKQIARQQAREEQRAKRQEIRTHTSGETVQNFTEAPRASSSPAR